MKLKVSHGPYSFYLTNLLLVNESLVNFDLRRRMGVENILYRFPGRFVDGAEKGRGALLPFSLRRHGALLR